MQKTNLLMIYGNGDDDNTWGRMILGGSQSRAGWLDYW